ncbi:MAG: GIY-YIG nuclease family protein, partial [Anaerolineaceae bacterium]|nr:GIY-YIG nuclease family protein [Anaerolineaceae bacterium]
INVEIPRFGEVHLIPGYYLYCGSAHGSGGLKSRINRHLSPQKTRFWHIDYLTGSLMPFEIWYQINPKKNECAFLHFLHNELKGKLPIIGFGSSDCKMKCGSHLAAFQLTENLNQLYFKLKKKFADINRVSV